MLCPFGIIDTTILSTCLSLPGVPVASLLGGGRGMGVQFKYPHSPNATETRDSQRPDGPDGQLSLYAELTLYVDHLQRLSLKEVLASDGFSNPPAATCKCYGVVTANLIRQFFFTVTISLSPSVHASPKSISCHHDISSS